MSKVQVPLVPQTHLKNDVDPGILPEAPCILQHLASKCGRGYVANGTGRPSDGKQVWADLLAAAGEDCIEVQNVPVLQLHTKKCWPVGTSCRHCPVCSAAVHAAAVTSMQHNKLHPKIAHLQLSAIQQGCFCNPCT